MFIRKYLSVINAGWLFPVPTFSLKSPEMFPKDLLPNFTRYQSHNNRAVLLCIVLLDFFEDWCNIYISSSCQGS